MEKQALFGDHRKSSKTELHKTKAEGSWRGTWSLPAGMGNNRMGMKFSTMNHLPHCPGHCYHLKTQFSPPLTGNVAPRVQHQPLPTPHHKQPGRDLDTAPLGRHNPLILNLPWPLTLEKEITCHRTSSSGNCTSFCKCTVLGSP